MIESVHARQLGSKDFSTIYSQLCALQDTCPLASVKAHLNEGSLEVNVDRIRLPDWPPILGSLRINKSLHKVSLRGYFQKPVRQDGKSSSKRLVQKAPPVYSKDVTYKMCTALKECLQTTEALTSLTVQGIPLRRYDMQNLSKGISAATTIQHLSLEYCRLSHKSVELLCKGIQSSPCLKSINLTGCGVTAKGAEVLARLIKHQSMTRHSEAWKDSLRYRRPNLDQMPGLRRITLNNNPLINDDGALSMADALKDDLWLKALDLQHCGVSNIGATGILEALRGNSTVVVLDLRRNPLIDHSLLKDIIEQVLINADGHEDDEYPWQMASSPELPGKTKPFAKKKCKIKKRERKASPAGDRTEPKSTVTVHTRQRRVTKPGPGFIPWRSAARAEERQRSTTDIPDQGPLTTAVHKVSGPVKTASVVHVHRTSREERPGPDPGPSVLVEESLTSSSEDESTTKDETSTSSSTERREKERKEMMVRTEELERRLNLESKARMSAESQVLELTMENSRLKRHVEILSGRPIEMKKGGSLEDLDEDLLKTIEESFKKFHSFLDLLRDAGLGQLCSLVGLTPSELHNPAVATILQNHQPSEPVSPFSNGLPEHSSKHGQTVPGYHESRSTQSRMNGLQSGINGTTPVISDARTQPEGFVTRSYGREAVQQTRDKSLPGYHGQHSTNHAQSQMNHFQAVESGSRLVSSHMQTLDHGFEPQKIPPSGRVLPDEHISVSAPTVLTNVANSRDITLLPRSSEYSVKPSENRTEPNAHHMLPGQSTVLAESSSSTSGSHPEIGATHHGTTTDISNPPLGITTGVSYQSVDRPNNTDSLPHRAQSTTKLAEAVSSESHVTLIEGPLSTPDQVPEERGLIHEDGAHIPSSAHRKTGRFKEDLERKVKLVTVERRNNRPGPDPSEANRNNNSSAHLEEMVDRNYGAGDSVTPDHLRVIRKASENASFHPLIPEDATMVSQEGAKAEPEADPRPGYSDDDFDSSGLTNHSGVRTSTPERSISDLSRGGGTFNKSGELLSNVEDGEVASLSEYSLPEQGTINESNDP